MQSVSDPQSTMITSPTFLAPRGETLVRRLLEELGEDVERQGLQRTPHRVWEALSFLTEGHNHDVADIVGEALFDEQYDEMVTVQNIEFYSLCEHHMLPFFGQCHIAYIPDGRIV